MLGDGTRMSTYKISSDNTTLGKPGETVTDADLVGLDVAALIAGGHIEAQTARRSEKKEQE